MDKDQIQHLYMEDGTLNNFLKNRDLVIWGGVEVLGKKHSSL